jgi:hypothetical protein
VRRRYLMYDKQLEAGRDVGGGVKLDFYTAQIFAEWNRTGLTHKRVHWKTNNMSRVLAEICSLEFG